MGDIDLSRMDDSLPVSECVPVQKVSHRIERRSKDYQNLSIPALGCQTEKKLFGRSGEKARLLEVYRSLRLPPEDGNNRSNFVLISGGTGVGKSSLAESLRGAVTSDGGLFVSGKFDQLQRREPYAAFVAAFTEFASQICAEGDRSIQSMKDSIHHSIEAESQVLVDMIPALRSIIGETGQSATNAHGSEAIFRFIYVFRKFVKAVAARPVVILLDDLHWADPCSLDLLASLAPEVQQNGVLFLVTCREDKLSSPQIVSLCRRLNAESAEVTNISVPPLTMEDITEMISDDYPMDREASVALSRMLHNCANGNALFTIEYLRALRDENILVYDTEDTRWTWSEDSVQFSFESENLGSLIADTIRQVPPRVQEVLKVASCIGSDIDEHLLECSLSVPVAEYLKIAAHNGLLAYDAKLDSFVFAHDEIQATAYALIPFEMKSTFHVTIGRKLWRRLSPKELDQQMYVVLDQLHRSTSELTDPHEKHRIALMCLEAGAKSVRASTFRTASFYFDFGIRLLGDDHWTDDFDLSLALYNAAAETEYCTGDFARVEDLIDSILRNARSFSDKLQAYSTQISVLGTSNKPDRAIAMGLYALKKLGQTFPNKPSKLNILLDIFRTKRLLGRKSNEAILRLPLVDEQSTLWAMQFLNATFLYCFMRRPDLTPLIALRIVQLSVKGGLSAISAPGFGMYGLILTTIGEIEQGYRYGQLALVLLEKFKANVWLPRVYAAVFGCIHQWSRPFDEALEPLKHAYHVGLETGDIEYALLDGSLYCFQLFESGRPLPLIENELNSLVSVMKAHKQEARQVMIASFLRKVHCLMGTYASRSRESFTGGTVDLETAVQKRFESDGLNDLFWSHFNEMSLAYLFGDYGKAADHGNFCRDVSKVSQSGLEAVSVLFFDGMSLLAFYRETKRQRRKTFATAKHHIRHLKKFAQTNPFNVLGPLYLLEAELASVQGRKSTAKCKFTSAIAMTSETGHLYGNALACERAGRHAAGVGDETAARTYFRRAASSFGAWGSTPKVRQLQEEFPYL